MTSHIMSRLGTVGLKFFANLMHETFFISIFLIADKVEHLFILFTGYLYFNFCEFVLTRLFLTGIFLCSSMRMFIFVTISFIIYVFSRWLFGYRKAGWFIEISFCLSIFFNNSCFQVYSDLHITQLK